MRKILFIAAMLCASAVTAQSTLDYSNYNLLFYDEFEYPDYASTYPSNDFKNTSGYIPVSTSITSTTYGHHFREFWDIYRSDEWGAGGEYYVEGQVTMPTFGVIRLQETRVTHDLTPIHHRPYDYLSGTLMAKGYYNYGIIEAKIQLSQDDDANCGDSGAGFWTPATYYTNTEIDILDDSHDNWIINRVGDWEPYNYRSLPTNTVTTPASILSLSDAFHIISCEWKPEDVVFYRDGVELSHVSYDQVRTYHDFYQFILAYGACTDEGGSTGSGHYMDIEWIKVWSPKCHDADLEVHDVSTPVTLFGTELYANVKPGLYKYQHITSNSTSTYGNVVETNDVTILEANATSINSVFTADESNLNTAPFYGSTRNLNGYFEVVPTSCEGATVTAYKSLHSDGQKEGTINTSLTNNSSSAPATQENMVRKYSALAANENTSDAMVNANARMNNNEQGKNSAIRTSGNTTDQVSVRNINIYPNPITDKINISFPCRSAGPLEISIKDVSGRVMYSESVGCDEGNNVQHAVDASGLKPGVYFIDLSLNEMHMVKKLVKL